MALALQLALAVVTTVLIAYVVWRHRRPRNFPPGPRGFPLVGCLLNIDKDSHRYYKNLSKTYGSSIISVKLGPIDVVVLNDYKSIHDALLEQSELFAARPRMFLWNATLKDHDLATGQYSPLWKERKRLTMQHMRYMGFGNQSMEEVIMEEVKKTMVFVEEWVNKRMDVTQLFYTPIFSIMSKFVSGTTFELDDMKLKELCATMKFNFQCFKNDNPLNFLPYLRHVPGLTNFAEFVESHRSVERLLQKSVNEHAETYVEGNTRDFIDILLREMYKNRDKLPTESAFNPATIVGTMYTLYNAGVESMGNTLTFALLYMATWPEIQCKVQAELDQLLGNGRLPTYTDRKLLPYTEATILEILRYSSVVPLSVPHAPSATAQLNGYTLPKDTCVLPNHWAVHFDEDLWGDPEVFKPERFLDHNGTVQKPEYFIAFSLGPRFCPGETLARMELFLFFASLMQRFSFRCITGEAPPSLEPIGGIALHAQPFSLQINIRQ